MKRKMRHASADEQIGETKSISRQPFLIISRVQTIRNRRARRYGRARFQRRAVFYAFSVIFLRKSYIYFWKKTQQKLSI